MQKVIGVRFRKAGRIYYYRCGQVELQKGDSVVIDTQRGLECVEVVISPREIASDKIKFDFIRRKANSFDMARIAENHAKEKDAFEICKQKIIEHDLPMNLIGVEYAFDLSKIVFSFTANGRVDFRDLVRDLAAVFRTRIELHQVGVRDEAKLIGGIGCCGRKLCCASFLGDFIPVSIRMAKEQSLSLNPSKISGICGRLMCCLKFENDFYSDNNQSEVVKEPKLNGRVVVDEGEGKVISINHQRRTATIILDNSKTVIEAWDNIFDAEQTTQDGETIVAIVSDINSAEPEDVTDSSEPKNETIKNDKYNEKSSNDGLNDRHYDKSYRYNKRPQSKSGYLSQSRPNTQNRPADDAKEAKFTRDKDNRDNRYKDNKDGRKFQKRDRRNENYPHNTHNKKFRSHRNTMNNDE
ncbi:MAG: stage 0 sporulation protein [Selenomonadaceae bacterium]|nr:stage 0 sporulation protein [Selenomonadaceae bacterium]